MLNIRNRALQRARQVDMKQRAINTMHDRDLARLLHIRLSARQSLLQAKVLIDLIPATTTTNNNTALGIRRVSTL